MAGLVRRIQNLIVEDGEVKGKAQADRMRGRQLSLSNLSSSLVSLEGLVGRFIFSVANGKLS